MFLRFVVAGSLLLGSAASAQAVRPIPRPATGPLSIQQPPSYPGQTYTPVGAGVPGERVPGAVAPEVPRSKGRMLPRTEEPGLWAADGDPALMAGQIYGWAVLDVRLPVPDNCDRREKWRWSKMCADRLRNTVNDIPAINREVTNLAKSERACLLAALFHQCLDAIHRADPEELKGVFDYKYLPQSIEAAAKLRKEKCSPTTVTERVVTLSREVKAQWKGARHD